MLFRSFALAFAGTAAFWWLYFTYVARIAELHLERARNRTLLARDGFTYLHVAMVAGVIVAAVGDELAIAHPTETLPTAEVVAVVAGPAIYLAAHVLFRLRLARSVSWRRLVGALLCIGAGVIGLFTPALVPLALTVLILVGVIVSERILFSRKAARGEATPIELLEATS